ncbi:hypothetical protein GCM10010279_60840 [Streptomyces mutabilis]|nr:hypothetical protein GCM10010279_60840 [Streptomyces mutabilis]
MQAMDGVDPERVQALVEERRAWALGELARYERVRERLLDGGTEEEHLRESGRVGPYLTLLAGIAFEREHPLVRARPHGAARAARPRGPHRSGPRLS